MLSYGPLGHLLQYLLRMLSLLSLLNNLFKMTVLFSEILFFRKLRTVIDAGGENTHPGKRKPKL